METGHSYQMWGHAEHFKSHHSGMETGLVLFNKGRDVLFKSHHSGMETSWGPGVATGPPL